MVWMGRIVLPAAAASTRIDWMIVAPLTLTDTARCPTALASNCAPPPTSYTPGTTKVIRVLFTVGLCIPNASNISAPSNTTAVVAPVVRVCAVSRLTLHVGRAMYSSARKSFGSLSTGVYPPDSESNNCVVCRARYSSYIVISSNDAQVPPARGAGVWNDLIEHIVLCARQ